MKYIIKDICANITQDEIVKWGNRGFDIDTFTNEGIREEMGIYIPYRGSEIKASSLKSEIYPFRQVCKFLNEECRELSSFTEVNSETEKKLKKWIIKQGKPAFTTKFNVGKGKTEIVPSEIITYFRRVCKFFSCDTNDEDIIRLDSLDFRVRQNEVVHTSTISLKHIPQLGIRQEMMRVVKYRLTCNAVGTVLADMRAINDFTTFLYEENPDIDSLLELSRDEIEAYLEHLYLEDTGKTCYGKLLSHLRTVLSTVGDIYENEDVENLILIDDLMNDMELEYTAYTDDELKRVWEAILNIEDPQYRRFYQLFKLTGARMSGLVLLSKKSFRINRKGEKELIITDKKGKKLYIFPADDEIESVIKESIEYARIHYPDSNYLFPDRNNIKMPMKRSTIRYQFMKMIIDNNLVDDNGEVMRPCTSNFRKTIGRQLVDNGIDDETIASILGHSGLSSLDHYRHMSGKQLYEQTAPVLQDKMSEILDQVFGGKII